MKTGVELIKEERERQVEVEGCTEEHDDGHDNGEMAMAAAAYAVASTASIEQQRIPMLWPWEDHWWKSTEPIRDLVKAGALIAAEIDRLQRKEARTMVRFDTVNVRLTPEYIESLKELMRQECEMMKQQDEMGAEAWTWGTCVIDDLARHSGLTFSYGGDDDFEGGERFKVITKLVDEDE